MQMNGENAQHAQILHPRKFAFQLDLREAWKIWHVHYSCLMQTVYWNLYTGFLATLEPYFE